MGDEWCCRGSFAIRICQLPLGLNVVNKTYCKARIYSHNLRPMVDGGG